MSDIDKKLEDLNDFADLLRPEQRYYTNIIKKVIEERLKDREKIKELEEKNMQKDLEIIGTKEYTEASMKEIIEQYYTVNEDCVPKQKIKHKIEELKDLAKGIAGTYQFADSQEHLQEKKNKVIELRTKAEAFEELLQEEDK